jgi:hypothetical protein
MLAIELDCVLRFTAALSGNLNTRNSIISVIVAQWELDDSHQINFTTYFRRQFMSHSIARYQAGDLSVRGHN